MRKSNLMIGIVALSLASIQPEEAAAQESEYVGSSFNQVWNQVKSDPYETLPSYTVTVESFSEHGANDKLTAAARKLLSDHNDLVPWKQKLVHALGSCLAGTWNITAATPWTGYYSQGSKGLLIARASTGINGTQKQEFRSLALAGKIFPTTDPNKVVKTANFMTIANPGGTIIKHFVDAKLDNDVINVEPVGSLITFAPGAAVAVSFAEAENSIDFVFQPTIRQQYPIAELGLSDGQAGRAPIWLRIVSSEGTARNDESDFRKELDIKKYYPNKLRFDIIAAEAGTRLLDDAKLWRKIGYVEFTDSIASDSCDHRLQFWHPPFRH